MSMKRLIVEDTEQTQPTDGQLSAEEIADYKQEMAFVQSGGMDLDTPIYQELDWEG